MKSYKQQPSGTPDVEWLQRLLGLVEPQAPFPWQERPLSQHFAKGSIPLALEIPTGIGKTSVIAVWTVARALGAQVPRRLVYVVDRRAVVDQATDEAERIERVIGESPELEKALGLTRPLAISTLRGQHVDNWEWLEDPGAPVIVVGTVDLVGLRILFEGSLRHGAVQNGTLQNRWPGSHQAQRYCQIVDVHDALTPIAVLTQAEGGPASSAKGGQ